MVFLYKTVHTVLPPALDAASDYYCVNVNIASRL